MQYCFFSIELYFHYQTYPELRVISTFALPLHSFWMN